MKVRVEVPSEPLQFSESMAHKVEIESEYDKINRMLNELKREVPTAGKEPRVVSNVPIYNIHQRLLDNKPKHVEAKLHGYSKIKQLCHLKNKELADKIKELRKEEDYVKKVRSRKQSGISSPNIRERILEKELHQVDSNLQGYPKPTIIKPSARKFELDQELNDLNQELAKLQDVDKSRIKSSKQKSL